MLDCGVGGFLNWEIDFVRWIEGSGYDVSYSTDIDTPAWTTATPRHTPGSERGVIGFGGLAPATSPTMRIASPNTPKGKLPVRPVNPTVP
jgi:hypothetical protein